MVLTSFSDFIDIRWNDNRHYFNFGYTFKLCGSIHTCQL